MRQVTPHNIQRESRTMDFDYDVSLDLDIDFNVNVEELADPAVDHREAFNNWIDEFDFYRGEH